jgi:hypothetical protein
MSTATQAPARPFVCPACDAEHGTLGALLACCPRELRALTGWLEEKPGGWTLGQLIGHPLTDAQRRRVRTLLHPEAASEVAA